jgi:PST family polysaccharide transporter
LEQPLVHYLKNIANTEEKKRLISNFFSLSVLQAANYILPLITLPYLVRVLGAEYYGLLAFANATIAYFSILTDYGFNLTATREISIHRDNKEKVIEIFSSVMTIKVILMFVSFLLLAILVVSSKKFSKDWLIYFLTFGTVVGQVLFPVWFFQGMERMKYITYLNILSKVIFTIAIFIFVQEQSDYYLVPLLTSIGFLVAGIWSLYLVKKEFGVRFELQSVDTIKHHLIDGWYVFLTSFQSNILASSGIFVLGLFQNNDVVGYYSAVEKIIKALVGLFTPVTQALYPLTSAKLHRFRKEGIAFVIKTATITLSFAMLLIFTILFSSKCIVATVLGVKFVQYAYILNALSIWLFLGVLNNFIGIQYLTGIGQSKYYMKLFTLASALAIVLYFILVPIISVNGIIISMILSEFLLTLLMLYYIKKLNLKRNNK